MLNLLKHKISQDESYLQYIYNTTLKRVNEYSRTVNHITKSQNSTQGGWIESYSKFEKSFILLTPWFYIPWYITGENILTNKLEKQLRKFSLKIKEITTIENALGALVVPGKKYLLQEEQKLFFGLVSLALKNKNFKHDSSFLNRADKYLYKFSWIKTHYFLPIEPLTRSELIIRIQNAIKNKALESYRIQAKKIKENKQLAKKLLVLFQSDKGILETIRWVQKYSWLLNFSIEKSMIASCNLQKFSKLVAKKIKVPYKDYCLLTSDEIRLLKPINKKELANRRIGYFYYKEGNGKVLNSGHEAVKIS